MTKGIKDVIGKTVILPIVGRELPILADEYVDIEFGSESNESYSGT